VGAEELWVVFGATRAVVGYSSERHANPQLCVLEWRCRLARECGRHAPAVPRDIDVRTPAQPARAKSPHGWQFPCATVVGQYVQCCSQYFPISRYEAVRPRSALELALP